MGNAVEKSAALQGFAEAYTAAWCSQDPSRVAAHFAEGGSLRVNDDAPAVGREAIRSVAQGFMTAFPDIQVCLDRLRQEGDRVIYHWTLTGTNTGPGGTGRPVRISGYESWRIGEDGLILQSDGHFDAADYRRQLEEGGSNT